MKHQLRLHEKVVVLVLASMFIWVARGQAIVFEDNFDTLGPDTSKWIILPGAPPTSSQPGDGLFHDPSIVANLRLDHNFPIELEARIRIDPTDLPVFAEGGALSLGTPGGGGTPVVDLVGGRQIDGSPGSMIVGCNHGAPLSFSQNPFDGQFRIWKIKYTAGTVEASISDPSEIIFETKTLTCPLINPALTLNGFNFIVDYVRITTGTIIPRPYLNSVSFKNVSRPGASNITYGETFEITAQGKPSFVDIQGKLVDPRDNTFLPHGPGPLTEVSPGIYKGTAPFPTAQALSGYTHNFITAGAEIPLFEKKVATDVLQIATEIIPPTVVTTSLTPAEGSVLPAGSTPEISAIVADASGIDAGSIVLKLDGQVVAHTFNAATGKISYQVPQTQPLSGGIHTVELTVKDTFGNTTTKTWTFKIAQLTEAHLTNVTRPGATDIAIGEQYKLRALGDPGQTVTGILANFDRIPPQPGQHPVLAVFPMPEVSAGVYETVQTLNSATDADGFTASKVIGAVTNAPPEQENVEPIATPEALSVIAGQITSVTISNASRPGVQELGPGEFFTVTADGVNLTTAEGFLINADRIDQGDSAIVQGPFTLSPSSPQLSATQYFASLTDKAGNQVTRLLAKVVIPGTAITALSSLPFLVTPDTVHQNIDVTINGTPVDPPGGQTYNPSETPLTILAHATDNIDRCPHFALFTLVRDGTPISLPPCTPNPGFCTVFVPSRLSNCSASVSQAGNYRLTARACDLAGSCSDEVIDFTILGPPNDNVAPRIINASLRPVDGSTVYTAVVTISADVIDRPPAAPSGIDAGSIALRIDGTAVTPTFTPTDAVPTGGNISYQTSLGCGPHTVSLTVCDKATPPNCTPPSTWSFTVDPTADLAPPTVTGESPTGNVIGPATISATLLDNVGGSGVDPATVAMTLDGTPVTPSYNTTTGLVSYTPATLSVGSHTVTLTASDRCGHAIVPPFSWSFTVVSAVPVSSPKLVAINPAGDVGVGYQGFVNGTYFIYIVDMMKGVQLKLQKPGEPDIPCRVIADQPDYGAVIYGRYVAGLLICYFDLTTAAQGTWNIVLTNPDGGTEVSSIKFIVFPPTAIVKELTPDDGFKDDTAQIALKGVNFKPGMTLTFKKTVHSLPEIPCTNVVVDSPTSGSCTLNLADAPQGEYNLLVKDPVFQIVSTFYTAFTVKVLGGFSYEMPGWAGLLMQWGGKGYVYAGLSFTGASNPGNAKLTISLPEGATYQKSFISQRNVPVPLPGGSYDPATRLVTFDVPPRLSMFLFRVEFTVVDAPAERTPAEKPFPFILTASAPGFETLTLHLYRFAQTVFDPSEMLSFPEGFVKEDQEIGYLIHYINETSQVVYHAQIEIKLPDQIDEASLTKILPRGAQYIAGTQTLRWDITDLQLQPGESGVVHFAIKPKQGLDIGAPITLRAKIVYNFDSERAFETTSALNTIGTPQTVALQSQVVPIVFLDIDLSKLAIPNLQGFLAKIQAASDHTQQAMDEIQRGEINKAISDVQAAIHELEALQNMIQAQSGKALTDEQAQGFNNRIEAIVNVLKDVLESLKTLPKVKSATDDASKQKPEQLVLGSVKNFPNPSKNPHTKFYYKPSSGTVASAQIEIFTLSGKLMVKIIDPTPADGEYVWDIPKSVANGVYLYRVTISDGQTTLTRSGKMVLLR